MTKKEILEKIKRASSEEYETEWDEEGRIGIQKKKSKIKKGERAKISGRDFETKVRKDLEGKGWIVDKWSNNVDLENRKIIPARRKFNPFSKIMTIGTGFPDFVAFQKIGNYYKIIGVEVKQNGRLSKIEKKKCEFLLNEKCFSQILIAKKVKRKGRTHVEYIDFDEIKLRMR